MRSRYIPFLVFSAVVLLTHCGGQPAGEDDGPAEQVEQGPITVETPPAEPTSPAGPISWTPERAHEALRQSNPAYNGRALFQIEGDQVTAAQLTETGVTDLTPLQRMLLKALDLRGAAVSDLGPLRGLPLRELYLEGTSVEDLGPLRGMKLKTLYLGGTAVADLGPLEGMPLTSLNALGTKVTDLGPLRGMPLEFLWLNETPVSDISPLADCPLVSLTLHRTQVEDLEPLIGSNLQRLHIGETPVTDLTPIANLQLTRLIFTPGRITRGIDYARNMRSIREIGPTFENRMNPATFWALHDQGELN
jgi:hypothetical protein